MDLIQKALKDGRLKFGEKPKSSMKVNSYPLHIVDAHLVEPLEVLMIEATNGLEDEHDYIIDSLAVLTIKNTDGFKNELVVTIEPMVAETVETTEGLKSGNGNLSKPHEVMVVDITEEPEGS